MKKYFVLAVIVGLLLLPVACTITSTPSSTTPAPVGMSTSASTATPLTLTITEPINESIVKDSLLRISGRTTPDAVLSINGDMVQTIDENGNFTTVVSLIEGPNVIDAIATNYESGQASQEITVIYIP